MTSPVKPAPSSLKLGTQSGALSVGGGALGEEGDSAKGLVLSADAVLSLIETRLPRAPVAVRAATCPVRAGQRVLVSAGGRVSDAGEGLSGRLPGLDRRKHEPLVVPAVPPAAPTSSHQTANSAPVPAPPSTGPAEARRRLDFCQNLPGGLLFVLRGHPHPNNVKTNQTIKTKTTVLLSALSDVSLF